MYLHKQHITQKPISATVSNRKLYYQDYIEIIRRHNKLRRIDRDTFDVIYRHSIKKGYCWATDAYLAAQVNCQLRTLQYSLRRLEKVGIIRRETKRNGIKWDRKIYICNAQSRQKVQTTDDAYKMRTNEAHAPPDLPHQNAPTLNVSEAHKIAEKENKRKKNSFMDSSFSYFLNYTFPNGTKLSRRKLYSLRKYPSEKRDQYRKTLELLSTLERKDIRNFEAYASHLFNIDIADRKKNELANKQYVKVIQEYYQTNLNLKERYVINREGGPRVAWELNIEDFRERLDEILLE